MGRIKRDRARERVARAREKEQVRERHSNSREFHDRNDIKGSLVTLIAKMEWVMENSAAIVLATMLAWCGALLCWFLVDALRSFSHCLMLVREGWSWHRAMDTFQPPSMLKYVGLRLVDVYHMDGEEYDDLKVILKQIWIGSFICMCLCPLYLKVRVFRSR